MDIAEGTHEFILKKPIDVKFEGEGQSRSVMSLELREPTRKHLKRASRLKQMVTGAMMEAAKLQGVEAPQQYDAEKLEDKTPEDLTKESEELRDGISIALLSSQSIDLGDFIELFIEMALRKNANPIVVCEGEIEIKDIHFDEMDINDIERLAITYASFFCMPSVLQDQ